MKNKNVSLVILAAGMGSRYGGLKQIDSVGSNGESIIDFSIYDAIKAGFTKLYLIIQKQHKEAFDKELVDKISPFIEVEYVFQSIDDLPEGYSVPEGRNKPWGTTHALLSLKDQIKEPFIIFNADDYYGKDAFSKMYDYLVNDIDDKQFALMGYKLVNTLSDSGAVTRGVCEVDSGYLTNIQEIKEIIKKDGQALYKDENSNWQPLKEDTLVSMNFWAFTPKIIELLQQSFIDFLESDAKADPLTSEALLPNDVDTLIKEKGVKLKVLDSKDMWFGVTYADDKPKVVEMFKKLKTENVYPEDLWAK